MTKSELIEQVSEKLKLPNGKAEQIVNCIFDSMVISLREGDGIEIRGFGSFTVREYKSYEGRNPRTGETVHVEPKRLPFFKVGKDLRERVNLPVQSAPRAAMSAGDTVRHAAPPPPRPTAAAVSTAHSGNHQQAPSGEGREQTRPEAGSLSSDRDAMGGISPVSPPDSGTT